MHWQKYPFIRLLIPLCAGVFLADLLGRGFNQWALCLWVGGGLLLLAALGLAGRYTLRWFFGLSVQLCLLAFGGWRFQAAMDFDSSLQLEETFQSDEGIFWVRVEQDKSNRRNQRLICQVIGCREADEAWRSCRARLLVYLPATDTGEVFPPGSRLLLSGRPQRLRPPPNPKAFDFAAYMRRYRVFHRIFPQHVRKLAGAEGKPIAGALFGLRQWALHRLATAVSSTAERSVASALLLGDRRGMDAELRDAYARAGAVHVLAVSGLHVGFVYLGVGWLVQFLPSTRKWAKALKLVLQLSAIWSFALLTGGGPPVRRAATMFSFFLVGRSLRRSGQVYNSLAASAFLLLAIDPQLLLDLGFQLSYLAVWGIVTFQPVIYRRWVAPNRLLDYFWKLLTVSLAAQLATLPLTLARFHQMPLFFWLSGWVAVPAAALIIMLGFFVLLPLGAPWPRETLSWCLETLIRWVNEAIYAIQNLPGAVWEGVWLSDGMVILLYGWLLWLAWSLQRRSGLPWRALLYGAFLPAALINLQIWEAAQRRQVVIYHLRGASSIDFIEGRTALSWSSLPAGDAGLQFATENYHFYCRLRQHHRLPVEQPSRWGRIFRGTAHYLQFHQFRLLIVDQHWPSGLAEIPETDFWLVRDNPEINPRSLLAGNPPRRLILDGSNHYRLIRRWRKAAAEAGVAVTYTGEGAWIYDL